MLIIAVYNHDTLFDSRICNRLRDHEMRIRAAKQQDKVSHELTIVFQQQCRMLPNTPHGENEKFPLAHTYYPWYEVCTVFYLAGFIM